jgi:hypothetical protein
MEILKFNLTLYYYLFTTNFNFWDFGYLFMEYTVTSLVKSIWAFDYTCTGITEQLDTSLPYTSILTSTANSI